MSIQSKKNLQRIDHYINEVNNHMKRVALYKDFKDLYKKVVPPLETVQKDLIDISKRQEQVQIITGKFDETISMCAQRSEIIEYSKELKKYCREQAFSEFKASAS